MDINYPHAYQTYYSDGSVHSQSGPLSCAKRIADEINGYVVPVWFGEPCYIVKMDSYNEEIEEHENH